MNPTLILGIIIFQGLIFAGLIYVLRQFMSGHVTGAVDHLQKLNEEMVREQQAMKQKMAEAEKEYEIKMAKLQQDVTAKQTEAREAANKTIDESRTKALADREKIISEAIDTRDKMRQEIMAEMEIKMIDQSRSLVSEMASGDMGKLIHEMLLKEVIDGLNEVPMDNFQTKENTASLTSAYALSADEKKKLSAVLKEKLKRDVEIREETDVSLVGGVVLRCGTLVMDGSLANRLKEVAARLKKDTARRYQAAG